MSITRHEIPSLSGRWNYILCAGLALKKHQDNAPETQCVLGTPALHSQADSSLPRSEIPGSIPGFFIYPLLCYPSDFGLKLNTWVLSYLISLWCPWLSWLKSWGRYSNLWYPISWTKPHSLVLLIPSLCYFQGQEDGTSDVRYSLMPLPGPVSSPKLSLGQGLLTSGWHGPSCQTGEAQDPSSKETSYTEMHLPIRR